MARPTCATCAAFFRLDDEFGECRSRSPTQAFRETPHAWPVVMIGDWCLEHVLQVADEPAPFTPFTGPVLQCECASCKAERTPSAPPPPEPDPQGL